MQVFLSGIFHGLTSATNIMASSVVKLRDRAILVDTLAPTDSIVATMINHVVILTTAAALYGSSVIVLSGVDIFPRIIEREVNKRTLALGKAFVD